MTLDTIINKDAYDIKDKHLRAMYKQTLDNDGALVLPKFLTSQAIHEITMEGKEKQHLAFYTNTNHNVYLTEKKSIFSHQHPHNLQVTSSKGCITDKEINIDSPLRELYDSVIFREFLAEILNEKTLYNYADPLSSINLHYASAGQELGWHFDNSSFAITLLIQKPEQGGAFEYIENMRDADQGGMNYEGVKEVLKGTKEGKELSIEPGALVLFRGRNSIHRVTPTIGDTTRMLVVLAYNSQPNIALSESARMTFSVA